MQDDGAVGWDPVMIEHHLPWQERILVLCLLVVAIVVLVKFTAVVQRIWRAQREGKQDRILLVGAMSALDSIKNWLKLTLLMTALGVSSAAADVLRAFSVQKWTSASAISGIVAELLVGVELGLVVTTAGFAGCMGVRAVDW